MIDLRPIKICDLEWMRQLRNANRRYFFDDRVITPSDQQAWFERYQYKKNCEFFVIVDKDVKLGTISVTDREKYREIGNVIIDEPYRRRGIYTIVMGIVDHRFEKPFMLDTLYANKVAIGAFKSLGFREKTVSFILP